MNVHVARRLNLILHPRIAREDISIASKERFPSDAFKHEAWRAHILLLKVDNAIGDAPRVNGSIAIDPDVSGVVGVYLVAASPDLVAHDTVECSIDLRGHRTMD